MKAQYLSDNEYRARKQDIYNRIRTCYDCGGDIFKYRKNASKIVSQEPNSSLRSYAKIIYKRFYKYTEERDRKRFASRSIGSVRGIFREAANMCRKGSAFEQVQKFNTKLIYIAKKD